MNPASAINTSPPPPGPPTALHASMMTVLRAGLQRLDGWRLLGIVAFVVAGSYALFGANAFNQYEASLVIVFAIAALGQDWLMGRAGQISLGAAAFLAVGAYTTARLSTQAWAFFPLPTLISAVFGGLVGLIVGITGLRFRGLYLALSTLALQFIIAFAGEQYQGSNEAGFVTGIPKLAGYQFSPGRHLLVMLLGTLAVMLLLLGGMYRRAPGRAWAAIRQNEVAAAVAGVNVTRWKLLAFVGSSSVIAVAGSMYAYVIGTVNYIPFSLDLAVAILTMVFIGGLGSMTGAVIGAAFVELLPHWIQITTAHFSNTPSIATWLSTNGSELALAIYGLALLLVLIFERSGVVGILHRVVNGLVTVARRLRSVGSGNDRAGVSA